MPLIEIIKTVADGLFVITIILGLIFEPKIAAWEVKTWEKVKEHISNAHNVDKHGM